MGLISPVATDRNGNPLTAATQKSLGKDDFLSLLITKLTNQDPLNPLEDEDFIAQLAQFSSLEQMNNINESLGESLEWDYLQMQTINNTMATSLIGREVSASYAGVYLDDINEPGISFITDRFSESIEINILDANGAKVRTIKAEDLGAGTQTFGWDGRDNRGNRVDEGYYQIQVTATDAEGKSYNPSTLLKGKVTSVSYKDGSAFLQVNGVEIPLADIRQIAEYNPENEASEQEG